MNLTRDEYKGRLSAVVAITKYAEDIIDDFEQQLKEKDKELAEYRHSWKCEVDDLNERIMELEAQLKRYEAFMLANNLYSDDALKD